MNQRQGNTPDITGAGIRRPRNRDRIAVNHLDGVAAELRQSDRGGTSLPPHFHKEYQVILSEHRLIEYRYRGASWISPLGSIFVVNPGEVHSARVLANTALGRPLRTFFIPEQLFSLAGTENELPHFSSPTVMNANTFRSFVCLHNLLFSEASSLKAESALLDSLGLLATKAARLGSSWSRGPRHLRLVKEFLTDHFAETIRLEQLSGIAQMSPFHLLRLFHRQFGLPPHAYQTQVRIQQAKCLLAQGHTAVEVAHRTGFADHAHLTRVFKRIVGVTPSHYKTQERSRRFH